MNKIWKQITTANHGLLWRPLVYAICQWTKFESKSQHNPTCPVHRGECMQYVNEQNLKANHNWRNMESALSVVYAICQWTKFESKSQPTACNRVSVSSVCNMSMNKIWKQITTTQGVAFCFVKCMQYVNEQNLKANHNGHALLIWCARSVCNMSMNKIWKQITTIHLPRCFRFQVYAICQWTKFESKSQRHLLACYLHL